MRGSPLGRSWPLAVSMTTDRLPSLAAAKTACPHGQCALVFSGLVVCLMKWCVCVCVIDWNVTVSTGQSFGITAFFFGKSNIVKAAFA